MPVLKQTSYLLHVHKVKKKFMSETLQLVVSGWPCWCIVYVLSYSRARSCYSKPSGHTLEAVTIFQIMTWPLPHVRDLTQYQYYYSFKSNESKQLWSHWYTFVTMLQAIGFYHAFKGTHPMFEASTVEPVYNSHPWVKKFGLNRELAGINWQNEHIFCIGSISRLFYSTEMWRWLPA